MRYNRYHVTHKTTNKKTVVRGAEAAAKMAGIDVHDLDYAIENHGKASTDTHRIRPIGKPMQEELQANDYEDLIEEIDMEDDQDEDFAPEDYFEDIEEGAIGDRAKQKVRDPQQYLRNRGNERMLNKAVTGMRRGFRNSTKPEHKKTRKQWRNVALGVEEDLNMDFDSTEFYEETEAQKTLKTHPIQTGSRSKSEMMTDVLKVMAGSDKSEWTDFYNKMMSQAYDGGVPDGAATKNKASISATKPVKEDIDALFEGEEGLSEEFRDKAVTIFESAVNIAVLRIEEELREEYAMALEEEVLEMADEMEDHIDRYLSLAAEEWIQENALQVESSIKTQFTESFMQGLHDLFLEHGVDVPEGQDDLVESLAVQVEQLEEQLNEKTNMVIEMAEILEDYNRDAIIDEVTEGMALTQADKLRQLAESVDFDGDEDAFRDKLETLKEYHFHDKPHSDPGEYLYEEYEGEDDDAVLTEQTDRPAKIKNPLMERYAAAISQAVRK